MKICFYNLTAGFKTGGLETYCWEVGRALVRQGHEVHIIGGEGGTPRNDEVRLIALPYRPRSSFPNLGTRFRKLAERLSFAAGAMPYLFHDGYDAVIVNKPYDFPALWQARRKGMKAVTALRSGGTEFYWGDRFFARAIDHWLSTSAYNAAQVEARYHQAVTVIANGVDPDIFNPGRRDPSLRGALGIPTNAPLVVSTGRLVGWKGLQVIINALPDLSGVHYLAIGDGEARSELEKLAAEKGVADRVHFAGEVSHGTLAPLLACGDVFVQPSIGEEAFGISVVEALASGLPALVSNQGGLREIVEDGIGGRLLPAGDTAAWRVALAEALVPEVRRKMGEAGRARVMASFTWEGNARRLHSILAGLKSG